MPTHADTQTSAGSGLGATFAGRTNWLHKIAPQIVWRMSLPLHDCLFRWSDVDLAAGFADRILEQ
jgi:hypothetical protein